MKKKLLFGLFVVSSFFANAQINMGSISFDGVDDSISIPHNAVLNPTTAITIEAWIKAGSYGTNVWDNYIIGKDDWSTSSAGYCLRCGNGGKLSFNMSSGGGAWKEVVSTTNMPTNVWTHVAATFDGSILKLYINGSLSASLSYTGSINPSNYNLNIGSVPFRGQGGRLFSGKIDQVEIWNIALTQAQINQYKNCPPSGVEAGLVGFWNFEAGSGSTLTDQTGNHNNGTLYNNPTWSTDVQAFNCGTGITDVSKNAISAIYPNPATNMLKIRTSEVLIGTEYTLSDYTGRKILNGKITAEITSIDISLLPSGVYMLKIGTDVNSIQKIIKN